MFNSKLKIKKHFNNLKGPYTSNLKNRNKIWKFLRKTEEKAFHGFIQSLELEGKTCLDMGSGSCEYAKVLLDKGVKSVICVDFSESLMDKCRDSRIKKVICDVEKFDTKDKYDLVLCVGVLEFLSNPKEFVMRLKKLLKSKGKVIVLLPKSDLWSFIYFSYYFALKGIFINSLSMKKLDNFLVKKGFQLEQKVTPNMFTKFTVYSIKK